MTLEREIEEAKRLANWLASQLDGADLPGGRRAHLSGACLAVALDHHSAIIVLLEQHLHPSAAALIRPLFEAYVRGSWLAFAATDQQVEDFVEGKLRLTFGKMIEQLEQHDRFNVGVLSSVKKQSWKAMCDFTHTGPQQLARNMTDVSIERSYSDDELLDALRAANGYALLAATSLAGIARDQDLGERLLERAHELASAPADEPVS